MEKRYATLSLNPSLDRTMYFDKFRVGELNRASDTVVTAGSKGINVARLLHRMGAPVTAFSFAGGAEGELMRRLLTGEGIPAEYVETAAPSRQNIKMISRDGEGTEANEAGGPISASELSTLLDRFTAACGAGGVFVLCGSIPPGVEKSVYNLTIEKIKGSGGICALDCDGEALRLALLAHPDIIKPNRRELEGLTGEALGSNAQVAVAAGEISEKYNTAVICTLGEEGAVYADIAAGERYFISAPRVQLVRGFAGAGDTYLGAFLYEKYTKASSTKRALAVAASAAAAKIECPGTELPPREQLYKYAQNVVIAEL